jgi:hypothetical protein
MRQHQYAASSPRQRSLFVLVAVIAACLSWLAGPTRAVAATSTLHGTFELTAGSCSGGSASGTYLRMILPSGNASGPFMSNSDSSCSTQSYTPLTGGTDGGLEVGAYQPMPSPPFDSSGNALARRITGPTQFEGTNFATSTNALDPQTNTKVPAPSATVHGSTLTANLEGFAVTWNKQYFNQGSPKPDGTYPGATTPAKGTYDASTGAFTLSWTSQVVGGPFDKFTGYWHLAGKFVPASGSTSQTATHTSHSGSTSTTTKKATTSGATSGHTSTSPGGSSNSAAGSAASKAALRSAAKAAAKGAPPAASSVSSPGGAPVVAPVAAASTNTVSHESWHATWWLIALAAAIAVLGFGGLVGLNRRERRTPPSAPADPVTS